MSKHPAHPSRILIVSETLANCDLLQQSLADDEYTIGSICNRRVAMKTIPASAVDLVLLDCSDSDSNGYEICRRMKDNHETREIPVLMVTSLNEMEDVENAVAAGCDDFLTRPLNEEELRSRVRSLLRIKKLRDEAKRLRDELSD